MSLNAKIDENKGIGWRKHYGPERQAIGGGGNTGWAGQGLQSTSEQLALPLFQNTDREYTRKMLSTVGNFFCNKLIVTLCGFQLTTE